MLVAIDLDGTITAAPAQARQLLLDVMAGGGHVTVLTGIDDGSSPNQAGWDAKAAKLSAIGCADCWHDMVLIGAQEPELAAAKADWCRSHGVSVFVDNTKANTKAAAAAGVPLVLRVEK
jgi:hypothetical protein